MLRESKPNSVLNPEVGVFSERCSDPYHITGCGRYQDWTPVCTVQSLCIFLAFFSFMVFTLNHLKGTGENKINLFAENLKVLKTNHTHTKTTEKNEFMFTRQLAVYIQLIMDYLVLKSR